MEIPSKSKTKYWLKDNLFLIIFLGSIASAFVFFHTTPSDVTSFDAVSQTLTNGEPTVIEFYSNF